MRTLPILIRIVHIILGISLTACFTGAAVLGAVAWFQIRTSELFWKLLRVGQVALVAQILLGGLLVLLGHKPHAGLHFLYGVLPLAVSFIAEQFRIASAESVLDARGLPDAQAVGALPAAEQQSIVLQIVRRELGVMTLAAVAIVFLALRAIGTAG